MQYHRDGGFDVVPGEVSKKGTGCIMGGKGEAFARSDFGTEILEIHMCSVEGLDKLV